MSLIQTAWTLVNSAAVPTKFAAIAAASSGDNTVVAAVTGKQIRVLDYTMVAAAAVTATWKSSTAGAISGAMTLDASTVIPSSHAAIGKMQTAAGEGLVLNLSGAVAVGGHLTYILI